MSLKTGNCRLMDLRLLFKSACKTSVESIGSIYLSICIAVLPYVNLDSCTAFYVNHVDRLTQPADCITGSFTKEIASVGKRRLATPFKFL